MMHVSDDDIYRLAELTDDMQPYDSDELKMVDHIKACGACNDKFCSMLAMVEVTSEYGLIMLSEMYGFSTDDAFVSEAVREKVLAVVNVIRKRVNDSLTAVMEQANQIGARFQFVPSFAGATRGMNTPDTSIYKIEDAEDEKTFVVYDPAKNELMVQINVKKTEVKMLKVYVEFSDSKTLPMPMERKGNLFRGILTDIPETDFKVHMEECEE